MTERWIRWAEQLKACAQNGLHYCNNEFDKERYEIIRQVAAEIIAEHSNMPAQSMIEIFQRESGYLTPKLDIRGAIFDGDKVLMVLERADMKWTMPGGFIDINEPPSTAVEREVFEESGYICKAVKLAAFYDKHAHQHPPEVTHIYKVFMLCDLVGGEPKTSNETADIAWFDIHDLPELSEPRVLATQIHRMHEHYLDPKLPTDFD